ncbi:hypothetical protein [Salmonella phage SD-1_S14]|nr:hypothetical protein [Salmonella phage SD-1_S14]
MQQYSTATILAKGELSILEVPLTVLYHNKSFSYSVLNTYILRLGFKCALVVMCRHIRVCFLSY